VDPDVTYVAGGYEKLACIQSLWEKNAEHHAAVSTHFSQSMGNVRFEDRRRVLEEEARSRRMRVDIAKSGDAGEKLGYCVATVDSKALGEVQSFFVKESSRRRGIGSELLRRAVAWMDEMGAETKRTYVVVGNEHVNGLYARFGFLPKTTLLEQRK
jgi:ribosomal protein S18 acetylase RimI-like enzyme